MDKKLYDQINAALKDRGSWENKQTLLTTMRNTGVKRTSKPYANAPDLHYKLGDTLVNKIKPLYVQQLYGGETIASFVSLRTQDEEATSSANYWFDYQLKQKTNFEREMFVTADQIEERGAVVVKVRWNSKSNRLEFCECEPLNIIVPEGTEELCDADFLVHVIPMSEAQYCENSNFNQDEDFIKSIKGKGTSAESGRDNLQSVKQLREGITHSDNKDTIILWEIYERDRKGKRIKVNTVSPVLPWEENEVRSEFGLPYNKGVFKDGYRIPFTKFRAEIKDKGFYSERGTVEVTASHESSLNKLWNQRHQWGDFHNNPTYTTDKPVANPSNVKTGPGRILGDGLKPNFPPPIPSSLMEEMEFTRGIAEQRVQIPDLGASTHLVPGGGKGGGVTATQINAIVGQSGQSNDLRSRIFRMDLGELLNMAWSILIQYCKADFNYLLDGKMQQVPQNALHDQYEIQPNGSPDSWNKGAQLQKRIGQAQIWAQGPMAQYVAWDEVTKWIMEADDVRLVKRLYRDPGITQGNQADKQAMECVLMLQGYGPTVDQSDDDIVHIQTACGLAQRRMAVNEPVTPEFARLMLAHNGKHHDQAMQKKTPELKQVTSQFMPLIQALGQIAQSDQNPANVVPFDGSTSQPPTQPQGTQGAAAIPPGQAPIDPTKVGNMLATMAKAGMPVTHAEVNAVMAELGLPPLSPTPVQIQEPMGQPQPMAAQ